MQQPKKEEVNKGGDPKAVMKQMVLQENIGLEMKYNHRNRTLGFQMDPRKGKNT
jgi:hypothetical protein